MNYYNKYKSNNTNTIKNGMRYIVKHPKKVGKVIWDSINKGTYNKSVHGLIGSKLELISQEQFKK